MINFIVKKIVIFILTITTLYSSCDSSLETPHTLGCGGFNIDIGNFDSPCCSYGDTEFDIFDSFRNGNDDKNISTKVIGSGFDLNITSKTDFNGTICVQIKSDLDESDWTKVDFNNTKIVSISDSNVTFISKDADIFLRYKENEDLNCSDANESNVTSQTNFAIRPKEFFINLSTTTIKAGEDFNLSFVAGFDSSNPSKDYNETNEDSNGSFSVLIAEQKAGCLEGFFNPDITQDVNFSDGQKDFNNVTYEEIGVVDINISEDINCSKRYASVDCDDNKTTDWELSITPKHISLNILPYSFDVDVISANSHNGTFTYLANEKNITSAKLDINITAQSKNGSTTKNYNRSCYAQNLDINLSYKNIDETDLGDFIYYHKNDDTLTDDTNVTKNSDVKFLLNKEYFRDVNDENGSAIFEVFYNFARDYTKPINPFDINISSINVSDNNDTKGSYVDNKIDATFCFGRILSKDIKTNKQADINKTIFIEVFDKKETKYTKDMAQVSLHWYKHKNHIDTLDGNITAIDATFKTLLKDVQFSVSDISEPKNGEINIVIPKHSGSYILHLKTDKWLWYGMKDISEDYNDSVGSSCISHPCFNYILKADTSDTISSGNYTGGDAVIKSRAKTTKVGIKVFR